MLVMRDRGSVIVFGMLMAFMALLGSVVFLTTMRRKQQQEQRQHQVYIGSRCIYLDGKVHSWGGLLTRFESAKYHKDPLPHIMLTYSQLLFTPRFLIPYRQYIPVRIPIPDGKENDATAVVKKLVKI